MRRGKDKPPPPPLHAKGLTTPPSTAIKLAEASLSSASLENTFSTSRTSAGVPPRQSSKGTSTRQPIYKNI